MPPSYWKVTLLALAALVDQLDLQAAGEERGLAQPLGQRLEVELDLFEDLEVGQEGDLGAVRVGGRALLEFGLRLAALVVLRPRPRRRSRSSGGGARRAR